MNQNSSKSAGKNTVFLVVFLAGFCAGCILTIGSLKFFDLYGQNEIVAATPSPAPIGTQDNIQKNLEEVRSAKKMLIQKANQLKKLIKANQLSIIAVSSPDGSADQDKIRILQEEKSFLERMEVEVTAKVNDCNEVEELLIFAVKDLEFNGYVDKSLNLQEVGRKLDEIKALIQSREYVFDNSPKQEIDLTDK